MDTSETVLFVGDPESDPEIADEIDALATSLAERARETLERLEGRYHVDLDRLFEIMQEHGLRSRLGSEWPMFQGRTAEEIEAWDDTFALAATRLKLAGPLLLGEWAQSLIALFDDPRYLSEHATGRGGSALVFAKVPTRDALTDLQASEDRERIAVAELAQAGGAYVDSSSNRMVVPFPDQVVAAIKVLDKAAWTFRRRDFKSAVDAETGRPIFGRGPRRKFACEADCARALVQFFQSETKQPLYEYVGKLLMWTALGSVDS